MKSFEDLEVKIALMHVYARVASLTTKPRFRSAKL